MQYGHGGTREGSGRKSLGAEPRQHLTIKLEPKFIEWLREHKNYNSLIQSLLEQEMIKEKNNLSLKS